MVVNFLYQTVTGKLLVAPMLSLQPEDHSNRDDGALVNKHRWQRAAGQNQVYEASPAAAAMMMPPARNGWRRNPDQKMSAKNGGSSGLVASRAPRRPARPLPPQPKKISGCTIMRRHRGKNRLSSRCNQSGFRLVAIRAGEQQT